MGSDFWVKKKDPSKPGLKNTSGLKNIKIKIPNSRNIFRNILLDLWRTLRK